MKKLNLSIPVIFILFAGIFLMGCASKKSLVGKNGYDLQYQLKEGSSFVVASATETHTKMDQMGQIIETDLTGKNNNSFTVITADKENGVSLEIEFAGIEQTVNSPMGEVTTDFSELIGKKATFKLTPKGKAEDMQNFDKLPEITTSTGETLNEELYKQGISGTFINFPEKLVKLGETWTDESSTDIPYGGGSLKNVNTTIFTLVEKTNFEGLECLKIESTGISKLTGGFEQNGMPLSIQRETKSNSTMYFAIEKGMYISFVSEAVGDGLITVEGQGIEIPQTINTKATVTVKF